MKQVANSDDDDDDDYDAMTTFFHILNKRKEMKTGCCIDSLIAYAIGHFPLENNFKVFINFKTMTMTMTTTGSMMTAENVYIISISIPRINSFSVLC